MDVAAHVAIHVGAIELWSSHMTWCVHAGPVSTPEVTDYQKIHKLIYRIHPGLWGNFRS